MNIKKGQPQDLQHLFIQRFPFIDAIQRFFTVNFEQSTMNVSTQNYAFDLVLAHDRV